MLNLLNFVNHKYTPIPSKNEPRRAKIVSFTMLDLLDVALFLSINGFGAYVRKTKKTMSPRESKMT